MLTAYDHHIYDSDQMELIAPDGTITPKVHFRAFPLFPGPTLVDKYIKVVKKYTPVGINIRQRITDPGFPGANGNIGILIDVANMDNTGVVASLSGLDLFDWMRNPANHELILKDRLANLPY